MSAWQEVQGATAEQTLDEVLDWLAERIAETPAIRERVEARLSL